MEVRELLLKETKDQSTSKLVNGKGYTRRDTFVLRWLTKYVAIYLEYA